MADATFYYTGSNEAISFILSANVSRFFNPLNNPLGKYFKLFSYKVKYCSFLVSLNKSASNEFIRFSLSFNPSRVRNEIWKKRSIQKKILYYRIKI